MTEGGPHLKEVQVDICQAGPCHACLHLAAQQRDLLLCIERQAAGLTLRHLGARKPAVCADPSNAAVPPLTATICHDAWGKSAAYCTTRMCPTSNFMWSLMMPSTRNRRWPCRKCISSSCE